MKTFAEYLPTMTAREREIVEAFWSYPCDCEMKKDVALMRSTPPAKDPVSVDGTFGDNPDDHAFLINWDKPLPFQPGDLVRVVKIEEVQQ